MHMYVAGYYVSFETMRTIMKGLQIPDYGVENDRIEFAINDWLAEHNHLNVLAGAIAHPTRATSKQEDGMLLMTQFIQTNKNNPIIKHVTEDEQGDIPVKEWLAKEGGVHLEKFEWLGLWDDYGLTRMGTVPERNDIHTLPRRKVVPVSDEDWRGWLDSPGNITLGTYIQCKQRLNAAKSEQAPE